MTKARQDDTVGSDPVARLAVAVIKRALDDRDRTGPVGASARTFLNGSAGLEGWCGVARVDAGLVTERVKGGHGPPEETCARLTKVRVD